MMNCNKYRELILLKASGELSKNKSALLENHLTNCDECRSFEKDSLILTDNISKISTDETPHHSVIVNIREAAEHKQKKHELLWFPTHAVRLAAYAAILLFMAGTMLITTESTYNSQTIPSLNRAAKSSQAARISELNTMIAIVDDDESAKNEAAVTPEKSDNLEAFAKKLLKMQGFAVDEDFDDKKQLNLLEEPDPTTTQYHKTRALPAKKCA